MWAGLEIKHVVVQFLSDELVLLEALIGDVEDRVSIGRLVVHVEDDMGLWNRDDGWDVARLRLDAILTDRDMHVGSIPLQKLHWTKQGKVSNWFWLQGISIIAFEIAAHYAILKGPSIVLLWFDDLAAELNSFEPLGREGVDIDGSWMHQDADGITVGSVGVCAIDVSLE